MEQVINYIFVALAVMLMFCAALFAHELGHYWVALWRRMKVEALAIGVGPKIISRVQNGIEYSIRWIPAGAFVRIPQMITSEALEGANQTDVQKLPPASPFSKILVALGGPLMNIGFAFVVATVIYFVGLPVPVNPSIVGYVPPDSPEAKLGIRPGDRIVAIDGQSVASWQEIMATTALSPSSTFLVEMERNGARTNYALVAKVDNSLGLKVLNLDPSDHPVIGNIEPGKPAERAGLQPGDKFISFAGVPIFAHEQLVDVINKRAGRESEVVVERQGQRKTLSVTPLMDKELKRGRIGISFANSPLQYELQRPGPLPWVQVADVWNKTIRTLMALVHSRQTGVGVKDFSGPPGILAMMAIQVNTDYRLGLSFLVLLNVNLAILMLLPIPVLDGGHIVLALVEKIWRRPLNAKFIEYTTVAFGVLLITFMLYVSLNDFKRMPQFKELFQRTTTVEQPAKPANSPPTDPLPSPALPR
jgi:regulator of sigma E protease